MMTFDLFLCTTSVELLQFNVVCVLLKVRPRYTVCRDSVGECDVPEFCDGISGQVCFYQYIGCLPS